MKIAVTCENTEIDGLVPNTFKDSEFLMIIDADRNEIFKIYGRQDPENMVFAEKVLEHDCEAIICGPMEKEPFEKLAFAGVTRYNGAGKKVQTAYRQMNRYQLDWIADYIGGPGPFGHSHSGHCEGLDADEEEQ